MLSEAEQNTAPVLVVDDEQGTLDLIQFILAEHGGYEMVPASSGRAALAILSAERRQAHDWDVCRIDSVVLDLMMPGIDGFKVLQEIRHDRELEHLPVIVLTALGDERTRQAAIQFGADDFITKPFRPDHLLNILSSRVQAKRRADALIRQNKESLALDAVLSAAHASLTPRHVTENSLRVIISRLGALGGAVCLPDSGPGTALVTCYANDRGASSTDMERFQVALQPAVDYSLDHLGAFLDQEIRGDILPEDADLPAFAVTSLHAREVILGTILVVAPPGGHFTERDRHWLAIAGGRVGIALETALLFHNAQRLLEESSSLLPR